jgi:type IV pilus assembly protein PilA
MLDSRRMRRRNKGGFTLIELMIVVAIIGVLVALALPQFLNYFRRTKTAEVGPNLRNMFTGAVAYYHAERGPRGLVATGAATAGNTHCLVAPVAAIGTPTDQKMDISTAVSASPSLRGINFTLGDPVYFAYGLNSAGALCGVNNDENAYVFFANGNLDGVAPSSTYELLSGARNSDLIRAPSVYVAPGTDLN